MTADRVSQHQMLRRERGHGNIIILVQLRTSRVGKHLRWLETDKNVILAITPTLLPTINLWVNVTTGYTLVKTRHSRVPTYLQRETDTADWSTPTFTLAVSEKRRGIPCHVYFSPELHPDFSKCTLTWREVGPFHRLFSPHESLLAPSKGHQKPNLPALNKQCQPALLL